MENAETWNLKGVRHPKMSFYRLYKECPVLLMWWCCGWNDL